MDSPVKKGPRPSRKATLDRCKEVADKVSGAKTPLDQAFAAFDDAVGDDPERLKALQEHVRALLARGM